MFKKRGLSAVITTLIVILLVLVSVGILWVVVRNLIQEGSEQIDLGAFTLDLQIKKVEVTGDNVTVTVFVKRNPGQGNFVGINFVFSDGKNSEIMRKDTVLKELEERSFTFTLTEISTNELETVSIAPIYELSSGRESTGDLSDTFDAKKGKSIATGGVIAPPEGNFVALGYGGAGRVEYGPFSSDNPKLPEFKKAIVDPLDVLPGDNQTFVVHVYSPHGVINVTSVTELDNSVLYLNFNKTSEYEENEELIEVWSAEWIVNDTHTIEYRTNVTATDSGGNSNFIVLTWTDSCQSQITHGASSTINTDCSTGTNIIAGLDGGSLTVASARTLIIDSGATWAFNDGTSIFVDGTITVNGAIKKGNLYYTDADGDLHAPNSVLSFGSGGVRAKDALGTTDCNDASSVVMITRTQRLDGDGDGYTVTGSSFCASSSTWGNSACTTAGSDYANNSASSCLLIGSLSGTDCYDSNADANPGQTSFFTTHRGDTSFDYNCDSISSKNVATYTATCTDDCPGPGRCDCSSCSDSGSTATPACGSSYTDPECTQVVGCNPGIEDCRSATKTVACR